MASATTQVKSRWLSEKDQNSLRQMFNNFFTKTAKVIVELRSYSQLNVYGERMTSSDTDVAETDLWFCIGTDVAFARANLISKLYLWTKSDITTLPPLVIETVYDLTQLGPDQELFIDDEPLTRSKTKRKEIVLERWLIRLNLSRFDNDITDIKSLYQRISMLMRCMYTLLGQLPAYRLLLSSDHREHIKTHILDGSQPIRSKGRFGLQKSLTLGKVESDKVQSRTFNPIMTPIGELETSVSYRLNCNFHLETTESSALSVIHVPRNTTASQVKETIDVNTTNTTTIAQTATSTQTAMGISGDHPSSISPTYSNMRYRASSTSINSLTSRRKPSGKGISLFKTRSIASSSPPPAVGPIPVSRNDSTSTSSVHFFNTGSHRVAVTPTPGTATSSTTAPVTATTTTTTATAVATSCSPSQGILITSVSSKYPSSSQGSRYRGNSMDNTPGSNLNPILQSFRFRNKLASSLSDAEVDPTIIGGIGGSSGSPGKAVISGGSLGTGTGTGTGTSTGAGTGTVEDAYGSSFVADDDLNAFMRMLDSKPDLRVSNHSSIFNVNAHGNTSVNEESMMNFRNIRKQNELFAGTGTGVGGAGETSLRGSIGSASPPPAIGYLHMHTPPTSLALARRTFSSSSMDSASKHLSLPAPAPAPAPPPAVSGEPMDSTVRLLQEHGGNRGSVSTSRSRSQSRSSRGSFGVSIGPVDTTTNVVGTTLKAAPISETAHVLGTSVLTTTTSDNVTATAMTTRGSESGSVGMLRRMSSSAARRPPPRETPHGHAQGHTETSHMKALRALSYGADVFASDGEGEGEGEGDDDVHEDLLFEMSDVVR